jgi:hypothetical protein
MNANVLKLVLKSTYVNGWPLIRYKYNQENFQSLSINSGLTTLEVPITKNNKKHVQLCIERYGKTCDNQTEDKDQIIEIISATVDQTAVPEFIFNKFSKFMFNNETHQGSRYFSPNGIWIFEFDQPIITWILDQKILHESLYNQDYIYPWSYKFGPDSVNSLSTHLNSTYNKVKQIL